MYVFIFFDRFKIDELTEEVEHRVFWLPAYHCHFNPIELIWSQVKNVLQERHWLKWVINGSLLLWALKRLLRKKMIQMTGQSH
jgi:transposase